MPVRKCYGKIRLRITLCQLDATGRVNEKEKRRPESRESIQLSNSIFGRPDLSCLTMRQLVISPLSNILNEQMHRLSDVDSSHFLLAGLQLRVALTM